MSGDTRDMGRVRLCASAAIHNMDDTVNADALVSGAWAEAADVGAGHRFRASVASTSNGRFLLHMVTADGGTGAQEFDTLDGALAGMRGLYAFLTQPSSGVRGLAADGPNGRQVTL